MPQRHDNLVAWKRADDLFITIHKLTTTAFPQTERFLLAQQIRRAAYSVPANIVEGCARRSPKEKVHFLNIAEASLAEVGYCLHAARRLGYVDDATYSALDLQVRQAAAPLVGLIRSGQ
jgi:four helix bundle protein